MSKLEIIEELCSIAEAQNKIIKALSLRLCELGEVYMSDEIAEAGARFRELCSDDG